MSILFAAVLNGRGEVALLGMLNLLLYYLTYGFVISIIAIVSVFIIMSLGNWLQWGQLNGCSGGGVRRSGRYLLLLMLIICIMRPVLIRRKSK
jgi:hypothetical protein